MIEIRIRLRCARLGRHRREARRFAPLGTRRCAPPTLLVTRYARRFARTNYSQSLLCYEPEKSSELELSVRASQYSLAVALVFHR